MTFEMRSEEDIFTNIFKNEPRLPFRRPHQDPHHRGMPPLRGPVHRRQPFVVWPRGLRAGGHERLDDLEVAQLRAQHAFLVCRDGTSLGAVKLSYIEPA